MSAQSVANFFLDQAEREGIPITPMKLVKLVYIAYGWHLALTGRRLFDEPIEAWKHGPVVPSLYHEFKDFGNKPIDRRSYDLNEETFEFFVPRIDKSRNDTSIVLSKVWASYRHFSGWNLRNLTHEVGSPWSLVYDPNKKYTSLNDDDISAHYKKRISEYIERSKQEK